MNDQKIDEEVLPEDVVERKRKRWGYLGFMAASTSQVAPLRSDFSTETWFKGLLCFSTFLPGGQESQLVHSYNKDYVLPPHALIELHKMDHLWTYLRERFRRQDKLLQVLLATLTHIPPCKHF